MKEAMTAVDMAIVLGIAVGAIVLIGVFVWVVKMVFLDKKDLDDV